jgi:hypothetical protein
VVEVWGMELECWCDAVHDGTLNMCSSFRLRPSEPKIFENLKVEDVVLLRDDTFQRAYS